MSKVVLDITMSLDGFIAGPGVNVDHPMGTGGLRLHDWLFTAKTEKDIQILEKTMAESGAVIVGGHTYAVAIDGAWGGETPFEVPAIVVTSQDVQKAKPGFHFVADGIQSALSQARDIAKEKNVWVMGGANIIRQFIEAEFFDELSVHVVPVLLGKGTKLFEEIQNGKKELETISVIETPGAVHMRFRPVTKL